MKARFEFGLSEDHIADQDYYNYLRHYFAGQALMGLCANPHSWIDENGDAPSLARFAVARADALISELNRDAEKGG